MLHGYRDVCDSVAVDQRCGQGYRPIWCRNGVCGGGGAEGGGGGGGGGGGVRVGFFIK